MKEYKSLKEFYPYYLTEHQNPVCRALHFVGTSISLSLLLLFLFAQLLQWVWVCLLVGYLFAWIGHFFFEKNRPATFRYPLYSFLSDFIMWWQLLSGRQKFSAQK